MPVHIRYDDAESVLFSHIQACLRTKGRALIALDGMAASGKTTLAGALAARFEDVAVVHMDDFFLPAEKRGTVSESLANADIERVLNDVLLPLSRGQRAAYRPFICHPQPQFLDPIFIDERCPVVIVEGAYCLHPDLWALYDLRAVVTIAPEQQQARILKRNGQAMLGRFISEWIPLENRHIAARSLLTRCDLVLEA